ncbi:formyltetrahydrofolate deformylase [Kordiimonas pumila]|uniref:Formyltetrahydrofolate deformylase n=1 Tax=Kordiimonas pumila TaxID=2161677 RepID=A0ABV7D8S2_9PROT|nr:formyltetrahydrofolate deformylase [Kordiimonas pumila]
MYRPQMSEFVITLKCPDKPGILAKITPFLLECGCDIREASVFGDKETDVFFIRMQIAAKDESLPEIECGLKSISEQLSLTWEIHAVANKMRVLIAVSKFDHCLNDLFHKWKIGYLPIDIVGIVSNHPDLKGLADWYGVPYHYLPITKETKADQEAEFWRLISESGAELTVLARYMQILSDEFTKKISGKCINIHHSFLPSFKGAKPYHQAFTRGVKLIGATAHYVTEDLDEGPIIEQDVRRITHAASAEEMVELGREVEASVLARAIKWHAEHRLFLNGNKTIVFN